MTLLLISNRKDLISFENYVCIYTDQTWRIVKFQLIFADQQAGHVIDKLDF